MTVTRATADRGGRRRPAEALALAGVRPHKSRGQNFLVQARVADRIVEAAHLAYGDVVVEIGPGLGILSDRIAAHPLRRLVLAELDDRLAAQLSQRFAGDPRVIVLNRDFLEIALAELGAAIGDSGDAAPAPFKVVSNLPFNAAAAILERLCAMQTRIARMVLMFQREVGERIRALPGTANYGALSVYTALYWEIGAHFRVAAGSFHPKPRVDAEVLTFVPRRPALFAPAEERMVLATVRAAFSAPRKTLRNALGRALAIEPALLEADLARAAIDPAARAATLAVADLVRLARTLDPAAIRETPRDA